MALSRAMFTPLTGLSALDAGRPARPGGISNLGGPGYQAKRSSYEDLRNYLAGGEAKPKAADFMIKDVNQ